MVSLYVLPWGQMSFWGYLISPICIINNYYFSTSLPFNKPSTKSIKRIGPHNVDIYSIIFGSLLGDGYAEKRANGTRIHFYQEASHGSYAIWLDKTLTSLGYKNLLEPEVSTRLVKGGKIRKIFRFRTYTYSSFNHLHDIFYFNKVKIVPSNEHLNSYLTPLALAIWIMDDGSKVGNGLKLCTNSFAKADLCRLADFLATKYNLKTSINLAGSSKNDQYTLYVSSFSMKTLVLIVKPYIIPSMKYKFGSYL